MASLAGRALSCQSAATCSRLPLPWETLRQALSTVARAAEAGGQEPTGSTAAAAAAARPQQPTGVLAAERAAALEARHQMQAALEQGDYGQVLTLLKSSEDASFAALAAARAASAACPRGWHHLDRAALYDCALRACAQMADAERACILVERMERKRLPVGIAANTALLQALCAVGRLHDALHRLRQLEQGNKWRTSMFTLLLRAANKAGNEAVARDCYALFQQSGLPAASGLLAEVVRMHGQAGDAAAAEAAWQEAMALPAAQADGATPRLHAARVVALAAAGQLGDAQAALESMLDSFSSLLPVDASPTQAREDAAAEASGGGTTLRRQPPQPAPVYHMQQARNALLRAAQRRGDAAAVKAVTKLATLRGLPPDVGTYNSLLRAAMAHGDGLQAVLDGVEELRLLGMRPNWETHMLVLQACAAERNTAVAQETFDGMQASMAPTFLHYSALLAVYSAAGDVKGADAAFRRMREAGFRPSEYTFRLLFESVNHWAELDADSRAASEEPKLAASNERTHQRQLAAAKLAGWVEELDGHASYLTPALFSTLLRAYSHSGQIWAVLRLLYEAFGCQLPPSTCRTLGISSSSSSGGANSSSSSTTTNKSSAGAAAATMSAADSSAATLLRALARGGGRTGDSGAAAAAMAQPGAPAAAGAGGGQGTTAGAAGPAAPAEAAAEALAAAAAAAAAASSPGTLGGDQRPAPLSGEAPTAAAAGVPGRSGGGGGGGAGSPLSPSTLRGAQLEASLPIFNAAIGACTRVGHAHMADAVAVLRCMLAAGVAPDVFTYTSLIAGCAYGRQAALAQELFSQMQQRGLKPNICTHNALLKVELWTHGVDAGLALLNKMVQQEGVRPDHATWSLMLAGAKHAQRGDVVHLALEKLAAQQQQQDAQQAEAAAVAAAEGGEAAEEGGQALDDHRWHGYYEQQEDEDEW